MWSADLETISNGFLVRLEEDGEPMSFESLFRQMADNLGFVSWYTELLAGSNLVSFFWEHPPLRRESMNSAAEFVLIDAPSLTGMRADRDTFRAQFESAAPAPIAVFDNLGADARLVAPCGIEGTQSCAHLAPFVRGAPADLICDLWQAVANTVMESVNDEAIWLSTSGLGVSWLHVRLDAAPKYYQHATYKSLATD